MAVHLIRHADAGNRVEWGQPDDLRALTEAGFVQAKRLDEALAGLEIARVVSSRYTRCLQTVQPLAERRGLTVEEHSALAEEANLDDTWDLVISLAGEHAVICSHGNVIGGVLDRAARRGAKLLGRGCAKASVWTLDVAGDEVVGGSLTFERG